jgi:hypothetical protein
VYSGPLDEVNLMIDSETSTIKIRKVAVTENNDEWSIRTRNKLVVISIVLYGGYTCDL